MPQSQHDEWQRLTRSAREFESQRASEGSSQPLFMPSTRSITRFSWNGLASGRRLSGAADAASGLASFLNAMSESLSRFPELDRT